MGQVAARGVAGRLFNRLFNSCGGTIMRGMRIVVAGMLLAVGMVAVVSAQPGGGFGGFGGGGPLQLIGNKAVQEDLKMTEEQIAKIGEWRKEFFTKSMDIMKDKGIDFGGFGKGGGGKGGGFKLDPEMMAKMAEAQAEVTKVAYKDLAQILNEGQIKRLKQIARQQMNINAFTDPETVEALKLTDSQKTSVKGIIGDFNKDRLAIIQEAGGGKGGGKGGKGGFGGGFGLDPETQKKIAKAQKEYITKIVDDVLEESQKTMWKELRGPDFDLTKLQFGGFGKKDKTDK
jgi:hypothetical protein